MNKEKKKNHRRNVSQGVMTINSPSHATRHREHSTHEQTSSRRDTPNQRTRTKNIQMDTLNISFFYQQRGEMRDEIRQVGYTQQCNRSFESHSLANTEIYSQTGSPIRITTAQMDK